jgi:hypothetical protein
VHLDFHTSEHIRDVGGRFSERQFRKALAAGRVDSVTLFAKCHHSWSYYPTRVGRPHPHLATDLLGRQIRACHASGVRAPIYYTVGWSANDAEAHPDWCARNADGAIQTTHFDLAAAPDAAKPTCSWKNLCPGTGYGEHMLEQLQEICTLYPVDGLFFDICMLNECWCPACRVGMSKQGVDAADAQAVQAYAERKWTRFFQRCRDVILPLHPRASVFFNGVADPASPPAVHDCQTHFELEDLPTTWGGYDKFPPRARFFTRFGKPMLAMSGKFHTMWGEFGGFKHPDALRFEAAGMVAYGAACSFGDQLHPSGEADLATWSNIGHAYAYVESIERFGVGGSPHANLAVVAARGPQVKAEHGHGVSADEQGVANMLMEAGLDFEFTDPSADLARYQTLLLTGVRFLDDESAAAIASYLRGGGSVLALGDAPLHRTKDRLALPTGSRYAGPARFDVDYTVAGKPLRDQLVAAPFLNYVPASRYVPTDAKTLASIREPYFSRTYGRYCSHQNTPYTLDDARHAAATQLGRLVHLAHPLGRMYYAHGARLHRQLFVNALRRLLTRPSVEVTGLPSAGRVSLLRLEGGVFALHLLYGPPLQRGRCLVIEDLPTLRGVTVRVRLPKPPRRALDPRTGRRLPLRRTHDAVEVAVPDFSGHTVIVFE